MQPADSSFASILQRLTSFDATRPLLERLGFTAWTELHREHWPPGLAELGVTRLASAGVRGCLHVQACHLPAIDPGHLSRLARRLRAHDPAAFFLLVCVDASCSQVAVASLGLHPDLLVLIIEAAAPYASDLEALDELCAGEETGLQLVLKYARVLDRSRVTRRFFLDFRAQRNAVAQAWKHVPRASHDERERLALLFLCRLVFLYFLQKRGHLGATDYLCQLWRSWQRRKHTQTFFAGCLKPLFFGVFNTRPDRRSGAARRFGELPYLNGGLFECHALERRHGKLDLPDGVVGHVLEDLLQRYRFTTHDSAHGPSANVIDAGVDPEMLGRVFEELMAEQERGETGTYFTPPAVVDRLVSTALDVWQRTQPQGAAGIEQVKVLDPACGSGAFLLGMLGRIAERRAQRQGGRADQYKREIVEHALYGVDLQADAALLCALRLWLCLLPAAGERVQPLPNLDRHIRQGDALLDPLELALASSGSADAASVAARDPAVRSALKRLRPLGERYVRVGPERRDPLRARIQLEEVRLAAAWLSARTRMLTHQLRELTAAALETDLFGARTTAAVAASMQVAGVKTQIGRIDRLLTDLRERSAVPFFSFSVHFGENAADGFDLVVSNPPWVRAHKWPPSLGSAVRQRYEVCRAPGTWNSAQIDLSLLFVERCMQLLSDGGVLAQLVPAKLFRSLYAGRARALILRELRIARLEDHSLDQHSIFAADAFAGALVAARAQDRNARARVCCYRRSPAPPLEFEVDPAELPLQRNDPTSPWLLVPGDVRGVMRKMQDRGRRFAEDPALAVHRGVFTGANEVLLVGEVVPKLGDHAFIRTEGYYKPQGGSRRPSYRGLIEESCLRPVVRGAEIRAWSFQPEQYIIWSHGARGSPVELPPRARRFVERHRQRLQSRTGWRPGQPLGAVFRVASHTVGAKVAWRDLAPDLQAVALPALTRCHGRQRELIPLNTVYYIAVDSDPRALLLAACLNSLPLRTFARAIAERAKDAHFRFFAWVIGELPLPLGWTGSSAAERLGCISADAHRAQRIEPQAQLELDRIVAGAFGLNDAELVTLQNYAHWLEGE